MNRHRVFLLAPSVAIMAVLFAGPLMIIAAYGLLSRGPYGGVLKPWTGGNYLRLFDSLYGEILWRSFWIATVATFCCVLLGFPLALYISRARRRKTLLLNLVMLPFWTSFLIRLYAWLFLLRDTGLINTALERLHIIRAPLPLLFNPGAVILGLVYGYLPFSVLPIYATLEKLDPSLLDSAADLGAKPITVVWKVIVPLTKPGIMAACLLIFIPCLGAYLTPDLMGGGKTVMVGNLVQNQFTTARDWPFGAALSLSLMAIVLILLQAIRKRGEELL